MNEINKRKIIFIGPSGSGKTTIVKIFFEMVNPINFLQHSLEPTKGINSSIYSYFNLKIGIFDLAGQENDNWFSKDSDIFYDSNIIICVFDITDKIDLIINFLIKIFKIKNDLDLKSCSLVILLHKIDLVKKSYSSYTSNVLKKELLKLEKIQEHNIEIFSTSIFEDFFFETFNYISTILNHLNVKSKYEINKIEYENLRVELSIILKCKYRIKYYNSDISTYFNLSYNKVQFHLERLEHLGFINFPIFEPSAFFLTSRGYLFKKSIEDEIEKISENNLKKRIEILHNFLNLNKVSSEF